MKYTVTLFYDTITRNTWEVEASSKDEAIRKAKAGKGEQVGSKTTGGELVMEEVEEVNG